jgi:hypothetical protein
MQNNQQEDFNYRHLNMANILVTSLLVIFALLDEIFGFLGDILQKKLYRKLSITFYFLT